MTDWNPNAAGAFGPWTITATPTSLIVGGDIDGIGGTPQQGFARFTGVP